MLKIKEKEKKKHHNERIQNVKHRSFNPLIMSDYGGFKRECKHFQGKLSQKIARKKDEVILQSKK